MTFLLVLAFLLVLSLGVVVGRIVHWCEGEPETPKERRMREQAEGALRQLNVTQGDIDAGWARYYAERARGNTP